MSSDVPQFNLRMPLSLKRKVAAAAKENGRSTTAEINARLESTFAEDVTGYGELAAMRLIVENATRVLKYFESKEETEADR